ncbi:hypothetical protein HDF17_003145 [Granulicella arctica]|uniref:Uncharacterized protein n=1 Tax=Granulicella arctica TaxID=940613 RepID=A0A7Y9PJ21_9BACT|nr:hypothetical protein [Granulicella arctica]
MKSIWLIVSSFAAMYVIATIVGFSTYLLIGPVVMWVSVFTLMPVVSAWLIYGYLRKTTFPLETSMAETAKLLLVWICLSFACDALGYVVIIPAIMHTSPNWTFFRDQSPWIWLSYAVLLFSGYVGRWAYLRSLHA